MVVLIFYVTMLYLLWAHVVGGSVIAGFQAVPACMASCFCLYGKLFLFVWQCIFSVSPR